MIVLAAVLTLIGLSCDDGEDPPPPPNSERSIRQLTDDPSYDGGPAISPDGMWVAFYSERGGAGYRLWRTPFAGGTAEQLTTEVASSPRYSADGDYIYFSSNRSGDFALYRMPADGGDATLIPEIPSSAALSPDGLWFAYAAPDPGESNPSYIWKRLADLSGPAVKLTTTTDGDFKPAWSPTGDRIVFYRRDPDDSDNHLYAMDADGSNLGPLTDTALHVEDSDPDWSWDGQWIAFERGGEVPGTEERIYKVKATGETTTDPAIQLTFPPVADDEDVNPCWSANGEWIAFDSNRDGDYDVYVISQEGEPLPAGGRPACAWGLQL